MDRFLLQANHNKEFLDCVESQYPDLYYDWKITIMFYISIHLLKCLANKKNVDIGHTHYDIENSLNPNRCAKQAFSFPDWAWKKYHRVFKYSQDSRYDGISDIAIINIAQKRNYEECCLAFDAFKSYIKSQKIELS